MQINYKISGGTLYVLLGGELDEHSSVYCRTMLERIFLQETFREVVFDLSELSFMDSTGIGVLIGRYKILKKQNKKVFICNPTSQMERIFKMSGLYEIMPKIG